MTNLFSVFSPVAVFGLPLNWLAMGLTPLVLPSAFWVAPSSFLQVTRKVTRSVSAEFSAILGRPSGPGSAGVLLCLFVFTAGNNFLGLLPYVFTASSHLSVTLALALPLWMGHTALSWLKQPNFSLAHLVPNGTPVALISFMVLIELLSNLIRPITLSVRLAANMIAGHLLFALLSGQAAGGSWGTTGAVLAALVLLAGLELAVAFIQGYVFSLLSTLYVQDVLTEKMTR